MRDPHKKPKLYYTPMTDCDACGEDDKPTLTIQVGNTHLVALCDQCWAAIDLETIEDAAENARSESE